ncbi:MAG TPA: PKD domain-containing protein [Thermoplasmatales archaeon]|nr:PKD domain-containing protein [Thermoplasmatales archaeon]
MQKMRGKIVILGIFAILIGSELSMTILNDVKASPNGNILDQAQEEINYGFWFEKTVIRWQEFKPTRTSLVQIDLCIGKNGNPGNVHVAIKNGAGDTLWETTIAEDDIGWGWIEIAVTPSISLIPDNSYYIYVWSDTDSPNPDQRYFWMGQTDSDYHRGISSVESSWPGYDFAFRTWSPGEGLPTPILYSPANGATFDVGDTIHFDWSDVTPTPGSSIYYYIEWTQNPDDTTDGYYNTGGWHDGGPPSSYDHVFSTPGVWYWHMFAHDSSGAYSDWSEERYFTVGEAGADLVYDSHHIDDDKPKVNANPLEDMGIVDIWWTPANPMVGETVTLYVKAKNFGDIPIPGGAFRIEFWIDEECVSSIESHKTWQPGEEETIEEDWVFDLDGEHEFSGEINPLNWADGNSDNNVITKYIYVSSSTGNILHVGGSGPYNYTTIQGAINGAQDGYTIIVHDDSSPYYENVVIDKEITIIGENVNTVINGGGKDVIKVITNNVTISTLYLTNGDEGIYIKRVSNVWIKNCKLSGNDGSGAFVYYSDNVHIIGCTISGNGCNGLNFYHSNNNTISNCYIYSNDQGIEFEDSHHNIVQYCRIYQNNEEGLDIWQSNDNTILDSSIHDNGDDGIEVGESINNKIDNCSIFSHDSGNGIILGGSYNGVLNCKIYSNHYEGVYIDDGTNNTILGCNIYNNDEGVRSSSIGTQIHYCNIYDNYDYGVRNMVFEEEYIINASYCYWGSPDGPSGVASGSGDAVSQNVIYQPWANEPYGGINQSPRAVFDWEPYEPQVGETITFDASDSYDPDGYITGYRWDWNGDGTWDTGWLSSPYATYSYSDAGTYRVKLQVKDNDGATDIQRQYIEVIEGPNQPPVADFTWNPANPKVGETVTFDASASYDPDGNIVLYEWDWNSDGIYDESDCEPIATYAWGSEGNYGVTLRVTDDDGDADIITKVVSIGMENQPPVADFTWGPLHPFVGEIITFDASNSYDPDGYIVGYRWDWNGDGTWDTGWLSSPYATYSYSDAGTYRVKLQVKDNDGATDIQRQYIEVIEGPIKQIDLTLYVEDAIQPEGTPPMVNKAPGDLVDIVSVVKNNEDLRENVKVSITQGSWVTLEECIIRDDFMDNDESELGWQQDGYTWSTNIYLDPGLSRQVVWRFRISESVPLICLPVHGEVSVENVICDSYDTGFSISDNAKAIIVTNRYLLYDDKYDDNEVKSLLAYLYQISDWRKEDCIIYYVDHYNENLRNWDQNVNYASENTANTVANEIDDLIETWAIKTNPDYLMIIGGDEIIPFYRLNDSKYIDKEGLREKDRKYDSADPILHVFDENYFLSDNPYADISGNDYEIGELELSMGRIVGHTASNMEKFIKAGIEGANDLDNAVVASWAGGDVDYVIDALNKKNVNIIDQDILTENSGWTKDQLKNAMEQGFQIFHFQPHSSYNSFDIPDGFFGAWEFRDIDSNGCISNNKPLMIFGTCRAGVVTDRDGAVWHPDWNDCLLYALSDRSCSGVVASGGIGYYDSEYSWWIFNHMGWGEALVNDYMSRLITNSVESPPFGKVLRDAKLHYDKGLWWDGYDKKTVTEFMLFGVPWATIDPLLNTENNSTPTTNASFSIKVSNPIHVSGNTYTRIVEINVTDYNVSKINDYDLIGVNGTQLTSDSHKPVIPTVGVTLLLPPDSNVTNVTLVDNITSMIGYYNIPSIAPATMNETGGLEPSTGVGFYPSPTYSIDCSTLEEHRVARVKIALIQYNPQTNETILYKYIKLQLTYQTSTPIVITDFSPNKIEYVTGEMINTSLTVENVGSEDLTNLRANLSLRDNFGNVKAYTVSLPFNISSGETKTIPIELGQTLPTGTYLLEVNITGSGTLATSSKYIHILSGEIIGFNYSKEVNLGDDIKFEILFKNYKPTSVDAKCVVYIYDPYDIQVGELPSLPVDVSPNSIVSINITWNTLGKEIGEYTIAAMVFADNESFGPLLGTFTILQDITPPITKKEIGEPKYANGTWVTSSAPIWLNATDDISGVNYTHYEIWWDQDGDGIVDTQVKNITVYDNDANDLNPTIGNISVEFNFTEQCLHELKWYSVDNAGNVENVTNQTHYVDDSPPETTLSYGTPYYTNGIEEWITTTTPVYLNATDLPECAVGVMATYYRINGGNWSLYTEPFTINEECEHTIEWYSIDYLGNVEQINSTVVNVDSSPPVTSLSYGSPYYTDGIEEWITTSTPITLTAVDEPECAVGVMATYYRIITDEYTTIWHEYTGPFYMPEECEHTIEYYSIDWLGNVEEVKSTVVYVDNSAPEIDIMVGNPHVNASDGYYVTSDTPIDINTSDLGCNGGVGVDVIYYHIWYMGTWTPWTLYDGIPITLDGECVHYLEINATDYLGNSYIANYTFYVDNSPPVSWLSGEMIFDDFIDPWSEFSIFVDDQGECEVGDYTIHFRITGPEGSMFYWFLDHYNCNGTWHTGMHSIPVSFQLRNEEGYAPRGIYTVEFWAEDDLGNAESPHNVETLKVDTDPPETTLSLNGPVYENENVWISLSTQIILKANDEGSGIKFVKYKVDKGTWHHYLNPIIISEPGMHTIYYYSIDNIGNEEEEKSYIVYVDNDVPLTNLNINGQSVENGITWIKEGTTISFSSIDTGAGISTIYYRIDDGEWIEYAIPFTISNGEHVIEYYAVDNVANTEAKHTMEIGVDSTTPEINIDMPKASYLYIAGREIIPLPKFIHVDAIIIGKVNVKASGGDECGIETMKIYINDNLEYQTVDNSIEWTWNERAFGTYTITIEANDKLGYESQREVRIFMINLVG